MRIYNETDLLGLEKYLNDLAKGITSHLKVLISFFDKKSLKGFRGTYKHSTNTIKIQINSKLKYPRSIIDKYMIGRVRLGYQLRNPHYAFCPQDSIGFIFLHELKHAKLQHKNAWDRKEVACTEYSYKNWKRMEAKQ